MSEVRRTQWVIEGKSNLSDVGSDMERIIALLKQQNDLTRQQTTQTLLATQQQREAIENVGTALTKQNTKAKTEISTLRSEYDLFQKTLTGLTQLLAGAWVVGQVKDYIQEVIKAKSAQDSFTASLTQMLGSKVLADDISAQLVAISLKSPFEVVELQDITKKLVGMGIAVEDLIPTINMLGDVSAVVGKERLPFIAKAFTDVMNKGVLMGQEIKQFNENGVNLFDLLAKSMEKPREEIAKLAEAHKITFADVKKALMTAVSENGIYYGQMAVQSRELGGQVANLADQYTLAKASIGDFFQKEIKGGIVAMSNLIHETIGSQAAIQRLTDVVKGAAAGYITYRAAVLTVNSAKKAAAAETVALAAAETAATMGTVSLTGAWNALKLAFVTNPIGAVITLIGGLVTAYYSWKAITAEVTEANNYQSDALRKSNKEVEIAVKSVMQHKEGTEEYRQAVEALIKRYPEYFAGLSAETTNNNILNGVLNSINASFQERIRLANLAYKSDSLQQKALELDRQQLEIVTELRKQYGALSAEYGNDEAFIAALKKQQNVASSFQTISMGSGAFSNQLGALNNADIFGADRIIKQKKELESEILKIEEDSAKLRVKVEYDTQKQQLDLLVNRLNKHEITQKEFDAEIEKMQDIHIGKTGAAVAAGEGAKQKAQKQTLELALENQLKELKAQEQTFWTKQDILNTEEKLAIEQAKRQIKNKQDEADRILSIQKEYDSKRKKLLESSIDYEMKDLKKLQEQADKEFKIRNTLADDIVDLELHINGLLLKEEEEKAERIREIGKELFEAQKALSEANLKLGELQVVKEAKFWQDKELLVMKHYQRANELALENARKQEKLAQDEYDRALMLHGNDKEIVDKALTNLTNAKTATKNALIEVEAGAMGISQKVVDKIIEIAQAAMQVVNMLAQNYIETTREAADSLDTVAGYIDKYVDANRKALQDQLSDVKLTNEQREKAIDESLNRESQLVRRKSAMLEMRDQLTDIADRTESTMEMVNHSLDTVVKFAKGDFVGGMLGVIESINMAFNRQAMEEIQQEMKVLREKQRNAQTKIQLIEAEIAARERALEAEIDALNEAYAEWKRINDERSAAEIQASEDRQLRVQKDYNYRMRLLELGEAREIKLLEEARDREVRSAEASGATAEEVADIINAFNELIADKHAEYQDAMGDKTKEISLATKEIKAQEKDTLNQFKKDEKTEFDRVEDLKKDKVAEFANFAQGAQAAIFEQQKQLAILEIRMEIAKLRAQKRKWFSSKKALNAAIAEMEGLINEITSGGGDVADDWGSGGGGDNTGDGGNTGGNTTGDGGSTGDGGNTGGQNDEDAQPKFHGDPWIKRRNGEPYGLDTILARLHEGERVVGSYLNSLVGPTVSNKELIEGYLNFKNLNAAVPSLNLSQAPTLRSLHIPVTDTRGTASDLSIIELQKEVRGMKNALSGKMTQVIINGVDGIGQIIEREKTVYNHKLNQ